MSGGRFQRLTEIDRAPVAFRLDGHSAEGLEGDTVLTAVLVNALRLRLSEFGGEARAGFCLMGACQDCWIWTEQGQRLRACSTPIEAGMDLHTKPVGEDPWPNRTS